MGYCTQADIEKQLPPAQVIQLADDDGDGVADSGVVSDCITRADDEINAYAATRYTVPFTTVPALIRTISVDLAIWNLHKRRGLTERDAIKQGYERAIQMLKDLAAGRLSIGETPGPSETEVGGPEATTVVDEDDSRIFTQAKLEHY